MSATSYLAPPSSCLGSSRPILEYSRVSGCLLKSIHEHRISIRCVHASINMATDLRPLAPQRITPAPSTDTTPLSGAQAGPCQPNGLPCLPLQPRQLRSPHEPHYRPAVLRPTERPLRHFPLTPPQSSSNSFDSLQGAESPRSWNRPSTGDGVTISASESVPEEGLLPDHEFGQVTSAPTRDHWKVSGCFEGCW